GEIDTGFSGTNESLGAWRLILSRVRNAPDDPDPAYTFTFLSENGTWNSSLPPDKVLGIFQLWPLASEHRGVVWGTAPANARQVSLVGPDGSQIEITSTSGFAPALADRLIKLDTPTVSTL